MHAHCSLPPAAKASVRAYLAFLALELAFGQGRGICLAENSSHCAVDVVRLPAGPERMSRGFVLIVRC